jgi:glycosyltransferase involved in cell wall biosynthesis
MLKSVSVIIPAYNESENLPALHGELALLSRMIHRYKLRIVFVNDCSTDNTLKVLRKIKEEDPDIGIIDLRVRSGEWVAFRMALAGFDADYAVPLPADLQIPCSIVETFMRKIEDNADLDVVYGEGCPRGKGFFSALYWFWLFLRFAGKPTRKQVDCFLINRKVIHSITQNAAYCNIVPLEIFKARNYDFVTFDKSPRRYGVSKYSLKSKIKMFVGTVLHSLGARALGHKKPEYELWGQAP